MRLAQVIFREQYGFVQKKVVVVMKKQESELLLLIVSTSFDACGGVRISLATSRFIQGRVYQDTDAPNMTRCRT